MLYTTHHSLIDTDWWTLQDHKLFDSYFTSSCPVCCGPTWRGPLVLESKLCKGPRSVRIRRLETECMIWATSQTSRFATLLTSWSWTAGSALAHLLPCREAKGGRINITAQTGIKAPFRPIESQDAWVRVYWSHAVFSSLGQGRQLCRER